MTLQNAFGDLALDETLTDGSQTSDVTDRSGRLLGHVTVDSVPTTAVTGTVAVSNPTANPETGLAKDATLTTRLPATLDADGGVKTHIQNTVTTDPTDRVGRLLGHVTVDSAPTTAVTVASLPLPATAAKDSTLTDGTQRVGGTVTVDVSDRVGRLVGHVTVDSAPTTTVTGPLTDLQLRATPVPVSNASLPLPTGAATEATLAALDPKVGPLTETAPASDTASSGLNGRMQRVAQRVTSLIAILPASVGQKTKAGSLAVVLASDSDTLPVSNASLPLPTGAATETTQAASDTKLGSLTETVPVSDTASSGLNGRLQRIAQRLTSVLAALPGSLGQKTSANSLAVTLASDQSTLPVSNTSLPLPAGASTETTLAALNTKHAGDATNGSVVQPRADTSSSGNITAVGQSAVVAVTSGMAGWSVSTSGTYSAGVSIQVEVSYDGGTNYLVMRMVAINSGTLSYVITQALGANAITTFVGDIPPAATHLRARVTAWASPTGTLVATIGQSVLRASPPVAIGTVAVSAITPGVASLSLGKAEDAAHATGDTGIAVWGVRNDTQATTTNADADYIQQSYDARGAARVNPASFAYQNIVTSTTTTVKSGVGELHSITINALGTVASTVTVYDNTAGSGTKIATINSLSITGTLTFDCAFATGLTLVTTGTVAPDVTVSYR